MRFRRRRNDDDTVVLPSLDRLSGLIERVVELVDAVGDAKQVPAPEPVAEPPREALEPAPPAAGAAVGWVAFVHSPHGYRLVDGPGAAPARGELVELEGARYRVVKVARSPLPDDRRRCAYLEGEEPQEADRSSVA